MKCPHCNQKIENQHCWTSQTAHSYYSHGCEKCGKEFLIVEGIPMIEENYTTLSPTTQILSAKALLTAVTLRVHSRLLMSLSFLPVARSVSSAQSRSGSGRFFRRVVVLDAHPGNAKLEEGELCKDGRT